MSISDHISQMHDLEQRLAALQARFNAEVTNLQDRLPAIPEGTDRPSRTIAHYLAINAQVVRDLLKPFDASFGMAELAPERDVRTGVFAIEAVAKLAKFSKDGGDVIITSSTLRHESHEKDGVEFVTISGTLHAKRKVLAQPSIDGHPHTRL